MARVYYLEEMKSTVKEFIVKKREIPGAIIRSVTNVIVILMGVCHYLRMS